MAVRKFGFQQDENEPEDEGAKRPGDEFIPASELVKDSKRVAWQLRELKKLLDEWEAERGHPLTEEDFERVERAWPGSR